MIKKPFLFFPFIYMYHCGFGSMNVDELYIENPVYRYTYFPYYHDKKTVPFALVSRSSSDEDPEPDIAAVCIDIQKS